MMVVVEMERGVNGYLGSRISKTRVPLVNFRSVCSALTLSACMRVCRCIHCSLRGWIVALGQAQLGYLSNSYLLGEKAITVNQRPYH